MLIRKSTTSRIIALILVGLLLTACAGCWDRREINQVNVATMIGFDRAVKDGKPRVLFSVLTLKVNTTPGPTGGPGGGGAAGAFPPSLGQASSAEGETMDDAMRNWATRSPRSLLLGHTQVVVIGEDLAREGIQQVIDFCDRCKDIRYRADVVVCQGSALEALQSQPEYEMLASAEVSKIIKQELPRVSKALPADLFQVVYSLMTPGRDAAMPRLHLYTPPERGSTIRKGPPSGESSGGGDPAAQKGAENKEFNETLGVKESPHPERKTMSIEGTAAFMGDKLVGWLNGEESMGAAFITNRARGGAIPFAFKSPEKNATLIFRHVHTSVKPVISRDGITFEVNIKGVGDLAEDKNAAIDVTKQSDIKAAEQLIDEEVQHCCQEAVEKCQSLKSDIFGFGDLIHKTNPAAWKQIGDRWQDYFPTVKVEVKARFTIEHTGVTGKAVKVR